MHLNVHIAGYTKIKFLTPSLLVVRYLFDEICPSNCHRLVPQKKASEGLRGNGRREGTMDGRKNRKDCS